MGARSSDDRGAPGGPARLPGLDGLRAIAVLLVLGTHTWNGAMPGGGIGVSVFVVLSGFLITARRVDEFTAAGRVSLRRFYARRGLRLLPALAVLLIVALVFSVTLATPDVAAKTRTGILASISYLANWGRAADLNQTYGAVGHTWSLSIEEQFYVLWPPLLLALLRWRRGSWALLTCLALFATVCVWRMNLQLNGATPERIYFASDTRADLLLAGCAIALARSSGHLQRIPRGFLKAGAVFGLLYVVLYALTVSSPTKLLNGYLVQTVVIAVAVAGVVEAPPRWLLRGLQVKPLVALGLISYGFYLWHYMIWTALSPHLSSGPASVAIVGLATLAVATFSYVVVERPALRLKRRFSARVALHRAGPAAAGEAPLAAA